jgi:hypothetical protein
MEGSPFHIFCPSLHLKLYSQILAIGRQGSFFNKGSGMYCKMIWNVRQILMVIDVSRVVNYDRNTP